MTGSPWATELASCLVGERVDLPDTPADAHQVLAALAARGWDQEAITRIAEDRYTADQPWPLPVDRGVIAPGPAQWYALVRQARELLGLDGEVRPPSTRTTLSIDERRLLDDVPPHW